VLWRRSPRGSSIAIGWLEKQFRAAGHDKDSRELAIISSPPFRGWLAVAHGANDPDVVVMEVAAP